MALVREQWANPYARTPRGKFHYYDEDGRALCREASNPMALTSARDMVNEFEACKGCWRKLAHINGVVTGKPEKVTQGKESLSEQETLF